MYLHSKSALRTDAVHFAIALSYYGLLRVPARSDDGDLCMLPPSLVVRLTSHSDNGRNRRPRDLLFEFRATHQSLYLPFCQTRTSDCAAICVFSRSRFRFSRPAKIGLPRTREGYRARFQELVKAPRQRSSGWVERGEMNDVFFLIELTRLDWSDRARPSPTQALRRS